MQKLQESVFSIVKTTSLSSAVFSFLQPTDDSLGTLSKHLHKQQFK